MGEEVWHRFFEKLTLPLLSQNRSNGLLAFALLSLTTSPFGAVPCGAATATMPPVWNDGPDATLPFTVLPLTVVPKAPIRPMPTPETGGSPSAGSPAHLRGFLVTVFLLIVNPPAGPGESARANRPAQLPLRTLWLTVPPVALRSRTPSPRFFGARFRRIATLAPGESPTYRPGAALRLATSFVNAVPLLARLNAP